MVWDYLWRDPCWAVPTLLSSPLLLLQVCPLLSGSRPEMLPLMCLLPSLPRATLCCWLLEAVRGKDSPQLPGLPYILYFLNSSANQHLPGVIPPLLSHTLQKTPSAKCELTPEWQRQTSSLHTPPPTLPLRLKSFKTLGLSLSQVTHGIWANSSLITANPQCRPPPQPVTTCFQDRGQMTYEFAEVKGSPRKDGNMICCRAHKSASSPPPFLTYTTWHIGFSNNKDKL